MKSKSRPLMRQYSSGSGVKKLIHVIELEKSHELNKHQASQALGMALSSYNRLVEAYENGIIQAY
jgi:hypothetical protein